MTDMSLVTKNPLTAEESALLYTMGAEQVSAALSSIVTSLNELVARQNQEIQKQNQEIQDLRRKMEMDHNNFMANMTKNFVSLVDQVNNNFAESSKVLSEQNLNVAARITELFNNQMIDKKQFSSPAATSKGTVGEWQKWAINVSRLVAPKLGIAGQAVPARVYKRMLKNHNINVHELFKESKYDTKFKMCANDTRLREAYEKELSTMYEEVKDLNDMSRDAGTALDRRRIPRFMKVACRNIFPGMTDVKALNRVIAKMSEISGININKHIRDGKNSKNCRDKYVSRGYYIANSKKLRPIYNEAITMLMKGE